MAETGYALHGLTAFVHALTPEGIEGFLNARGWAKADEMVGRWRLWYSKDRSACFLVPASKAFGDYDIRVTEGVSSMAASEGRHILGTLWEMLPEAMRPKLVKAVFPLAEPDGEGGR